MKLKNAIIKRIKEIKNKDKLTQYEIFKRTGVPQSTISTLLKGETKTIQISTLYSICSGLNINLCDFFNADYLKNENLED